MLYMRNKKIDKFDMEESIIFTLLSIRKSEIIINSESDETLKTLLKDLREVGSRRLVN